MITLLANAEAPPIFTLITLILFSVVAVSLILSKFRQSLMAGYFLCGVILANCGLVEAAGHGIESITTISDIGVILLMFTIGIEFSLDELKHLRKFSLIGGSIQMAICAITFTLCNHLWGLPLNVSAVLGIILGLSSTAVALKSFQETNQTGSSASKMALGVALFQDILAILLMATMPQILSPGESVDTAVLGVLFSLGKGALFLVAAALFGKFILPHIMTAVAHTRSHELFTVSVIALCACIATLGGLLGLSLALGAFAAGLVVSGSYYSHRVLSEIMPFRDLFLTLFFVSAGLLVDVNTIIDNYGFVLITLVIVCVIKFGAALMAASRLKLSGSMGVLAALALSNVGEFSLVLIASLHQINPLPSSFLQCLYAVVALTMGITPSLMRFSSRWASSFDKIPGFRRKGPSVKSVTMIKEIAALNGHAIICGYGPIGKRLHESLSRYGIPCIIVDLNADTIRKLLDTNTPALLGDIRHTETLSLVGIKQARLIAFTFPDITPVLTSKPEIVTQNPEINIISRAKFPSEVERLWAIGVRSIIHDEAEVGNAMENIALSAFDVVETSPSVSRNTPPRV